MTQPRSQQIKSVNSRYDVLGLSVTPGTAETVISPGSFPAGPGGADEDVPARVRGSALSPFPILSGYAISVGVDGSPPFVVTFSSTDTTVGRVALRVNAAAGSDIASNDFGHLVLTSPTFGSSSSISLADVTLGVLSALGLTAGVYVGTNAGTDGIVTLSGDGLGGTAPHSTDDGKNLVTDGGKLIYFSHTSGFSVGRRMMQVIPGGLPVVGRLTFDGTNFRSKYYAKITPRAKVRSLGSFFPLLDGSNTLTLNVNGQGFNTTFSSGPYTRDSVLDAINSSYASVMGISDPWARVDGTTPGPFRGLSGTSFRVEVDGGSPQTVGFTTESTASEVAAHITSVLSGATASVVTGPNGQYVSIRSSNGNGRTSSLKIYSGDQSLFRLGVRPGFYGGTYVADQYGPDEIEIASVYRGSSNGGSPSLSVSGSGTTLVRMGLSAVTVPGIETSQYEPVDAPFFDPLMGLTAFKALMCFPNVLEFGDVPVDTDTVVQRYLAKSAGSNIDGRNRSVDDSQAGSFSTSVSGRGFFDVGKPIVTTPDGQIPSDNGGGDPNAVDAIIKQITRLSSTEVVQAVVGSRLETPGNGSNPLPTQPFLGLYADPTNFYASRGVRFFLNPSVLSFSVEDNSAGPTPASRSFFGANDGRSLFFKNNEGRLSDVNIDSSGENGYVQLSSALDKFLRVGDVYALPSKAPGYNILRSLNARNVITVGNGVTSFGDFNGTNPGVSTDGLSQAINYLKSVGATVCHIVMKPGFYGESALIDLTDNTRFPGFTGFTDVVIEGDFPQGNGASPTTLINFGVAGRCIQSSISPPFTPLNTFVCRNIEFLTSAQDADTLAVESKIVIVENCSFQSSLTFTNPKYLGLNSCTSTCFLVGPVVIQYNDSAPSVVDNISVDICTMSSANDFPVVNIIDQTSTARVTIESLSIDGGRMSPGSATLNGINPTSPTSRSFASALGVGLIGLVPQSNAYSSSASSGIRIMDVFIRNLTVLLGVQSYSTSNVSFVALNIVPSGPQGGSLWTYGTDASVKVDNVLVEDMYVKFPDAGSVPTQMQSPCITIAGVGIPQSLGFGSGTLTVRRVLLDVQQAIHGPSTVNMLPFFGNYQTSSSNSAQGGLVCLSGQSVVVEDLTFLNTIDLSGSPELLAVPYKRMSLKGLESSPSIPSISPAVNALTLTNARLWIRNVFGSINVDLRDILLDGQGQISNNWANNGFIVLEGSHVGRQWCHLSDFSIQSFITSSFGVPGVSIQSVSLHPTWPTNLRGGGVLIERGYIGCFSLGSSSGTGGCSSGIFAVAATTSTLIDGITVRDVTVDSARNNGILLSLQDTNRSVSISDCTVFLCGNSNGTGGLKVSTQNVSGMNPKVKVHDNNVFLNNQPFSSQFIGIQINVRDIGSSHRPTMVSLYGNNCFDAANSNYGRINTCQSSNVNLPTSGSYLNPVSVLVLGAETGYSGQTGGFATFGNGFFWTAGIRCMHNDAYLNCDFSNAQ